MALFRSVACTMLAVIVAWLAWRYAPIPLAVMGVSDLEFLGQICAVMCVLTVLERVLDFLPGMKNPGH